MKQAHKTVVLAAGALTLTAALLASIYNHQAVLEPTQGAQSTLTRQTTVSQKNDTQALAAEQTRTGSGSIQYEPDTAALTEEQEALLLEYMYRYYESLAHLTLGDPCDLFSQDSQSQAQVNQNIWEYLIAVRSMQQSDLSLVNYRFALTVSRVDENEDGSLRIVLKEDSVQNFAQHPDVDSESLDVRHVFELTDTAEGWKLSRHMQMDSLYYTMMGWTRRRPSGVVQVSQTKTLDEMLTLAQTYTAQRLTQGQVLDLSADNPYDRQAAVAYAHEWVGQRNDEWGDYSMYGGNCQNFVSQALLAGGIPMDIEGDAVWKWYGSTPSDTNRASGRSASFSGVEAFLSYAANNTGYGLVAAADAPYYTGQPGDIIHMGNDDGYKHTVLIVDTVKDENGQTIDYLIDSNTADLRNFPVSAYAYTRQMLITIQGWND